MSSLNDAVAGGDLGSPPAVELRGITKRFGRVVACDRVDLVLHRGRVHGILGENGAGKSTLMKVLIGLVLPDAGQVLLDGAPVQIADPVSAAEYGIGMVHQHFSLVEALTVWENVALGDIGRLDPAAVRRRVGEISEQYGLHIDPDDRIADLAAGMRQRVEIIKCLRRDPQVLVFDEPTSVLTPDESAFLFSALRRVVADEGKAVALVSHKLPEVMAATDEITIMRDGSVVERRPSEGSDAASLARAMVGREVSLRGERSAFGLVARDPDDGQVSSQVATGVPALRVSGAVLRGRDGRVLLDGFTTEVHRGEIVGLAGVEGNGQRELTDVLSSLRPLDGGTVTVYDREIVTGRAGAMAAAGVSVIPEDRHDSGCVLDFTVAENLVIMAPGRVARRGLMDHRLMKSRANELIQRFAVSCQGPDAPMWSLSGGNQQRVVLARELSHSPQVLVAAQPTRGLDVGAIEYMYERLRAAAAEGVAVLLISTELEEILELSDRVVVISGGRAVGEMSRGAIDLDRLGLLIGGAVVAEDGAR